MSNIACCSSALVLAALGAGGARAQCAPSPSQPSQPVSCAGTQTGGYTITSDQSPLTVNSGASILNSGDALTVSIPSDAYTYYRSAAITVQGSIISSGGNSILFTSGGSSDSGGTSGTITVAAGGAISGMTGISVTSGSGPYAGQVSTALDNSGAITGTAGPVLATSGNGNFSSITNEASGSLGAIAASFNSLTNHGTIDGGALSAINNISLYNYASVANDGTIQAEGSAATVQLGNIYNFTNTGRIGNSGGGAAIDVGGTFTNQAGASVVSNGSDVVTGSYLAVNNYGSITNGGSGQAVSGNLLTLTNHAGATISGGTGGIAVNGTTGLTLVNAGTIDGSVLAGSVASNYGNSSVDSTLGVINGNVTFGGGNNTLVATIVNGALQTGITGTIIGGTGAFVSNTLNVTTTADATLTSGVALPTNFAQVTFVPGYGTTLTLGNGFSSTSAIIDNGPGTLANATALAGSGQIVSLGYNANTFGNAGTITATNLGAAAAIGLSGYAVLHNAGTITATGDGVTGFGNGVINSGTISAGGTAVTAFLDTGYQNGGFVNSGTIASTGGVAVALSLSCTCFSASNSGTISGMSIGLQLADGTFDNTGTITASGYGIAVNYASSINNLAGGVITGAVAIGDPNSPPSSIFVTNAGTINGNVNLAAGGNSFGANSFDAAPGGMLNGNLTLGSGDTLIADLANTSGSAFAGITGTVTANNSNLVYNVGADASVPAASPAGFASVGFQLFNNATLTMAAGTSSNVTLGLAGVGTVNLNGTISTTNQNALQTQGPVTSAGYASPPETALAITNNGSISAQFNNPSPSFQAVVALNYGGTLVNTGAITGTSVTGLGYGDFATVFAPSSLFNTGIIQGTGLAGVSIGNSSGNGAAAATLTNSGTIASDQNAVFAIGAVTITNSGTIASTGANGIYNPQYYSQAQVTNLAGGTISGGTDAILLSGGTVSNAGTINGNVDFTYSQFGGQPYYPGSYYDNGGTLNGNLTLAANGALIIDLANQGTGPLGGVTGTINANGGSLIYQVNASAATAGAPATANFGSIGYLIASNSTLTIAAGSQQTTTVALAGTGSVLLNGTISTADSLGVVTQPSALLATTGNTSSSNALTITNNGTITTTADANSNASAAVALAISDTLINNGTIAFTDSTVPSFSYGAVSSGLSITNTGTISGSNVSAVLPGKSLSNAGTITSNVNAITLVGITTITNSGTISSTGAAAIGGNPNFSYNVIPANVTNLATGVITGAPDAIDMAGGVVINAGTINGNVNLASPFGYSPGGYYDNGGTLNGNLTLTSGQVLLVDYAATNGPLGGVTGTIAANGAALLYNIGSDTAITAIPTASGFGSVGYQLSNNATVTIPSDAALTSSLALSGTGSVVLNGTIATSEQPAIQSVPPLALINSNTQTALAFINNGKITTIGDPSIVGGTTVSLGAADTLINNGTITLTEVTGFNNPYDTVVNGGKSVTNAGAITGSGVSGIEVGPPYYRAFGGSALTNSGTIASDQYAVLVGGGAALTNSGTIVSTGLAAIISASQYAVSSAISNLAGGTITGVGDAIDLAGGIVSNAGTINGNVNLADPAYGNQGFGVGAYLNAGGTLNGNLTLVIGEALVTPLGSYNGTGFAGINGAVSANNASLVYTVSSNATTTADPVAGFGTVGFNLADSATLTLTAGSLPANPLYLSGSGTVNVAASITTTDVRAIGSVVPPTLSGTVPPNAITINTSGTLATTLDQYAVYYQSSTYPLATVVLKSSDTLINTGIISLASPTGIIFAGAAAVNGGAALVNSGMITATGANAVSLGVSVSGPSLSLTNSGSINSDRIAVVTNGPAMITNSGTISGAVGSLLLGAPATIANSGSITSGSGVAISSTMTGGTQIANLAGGVITGTGDAIDLLGGSVANAGTINGNVNLAFGAGATTGALSGGYFATGGTLNGNLTLGQGETLVTDVANPGGGITGTVTGGGGALVDNVYINTASTAVLPAGFASFAYQLIGNPVLTLTNASKLSSTLGLAGSGTVVFNGAITTADAAALQSQPLLTTSGYATTANALAITNNGVIAANFAAGATTAPSAAVVLGGGDTLFNTGSIASTGGVAVLSQGAIHLTNLAGGTITSTGDAIDGHGGGVENAGVITGDINLGYAPPNTAANATPAIYIRNGGTLNGRLGFSSTVGGNELIETGSGFGVTGTITGGAGTNFVGHLRTASGTVALGAALPMGFSIEFSVASGVGTRVTLLGPSSSTANIYIGGNGAIVNQANTSGILTGLAGSGESYYANQQATLSAFTNQAAIGGVDLAASAFTNSGTITGNVSIHAANYALLDAVGGSITGNIAIIPATHAGTSGSISLAGIFAGNIDGGTGAATSLTSSGGTAAQPIAFGAIANITTYDQTGGYAALAGTASLATAAIDGGTFVGLVGSTLNAAQVNVAAGASFASGGTINGNLTVSGTLHVGASPDTLTVNGNVAIAPGSTSVFEISPTASAKLVVSGMATIGTNATLQIVQLQPIAPGSAIDLIDAAGGISGNFTTLSGITGTLVERGNELTLLALFNGSLADNPQVANGAAYLNALIASGNASPALLAALPVLQTASGKPATQAFARLTPQAYATATQIGVENALILSRAARDIGWDNAVRSGNLFTFGQALGSWRGLGGNGGLGVSHADLSGYGFIGGIGAGKEAASIAAFGGYLDQGQDIAGLAVSTQAKGFVGGATGHLASGRANLNLSVIYDGSHAATHRLSPNEITISGVYKLHSWTADAEASTSFGLGNGWSASPHLGATWVWTHRTSLTEDNASAFALTVADGHHYAGFVDGGLRLQSPRGGVGQLAVFVDIGARYQFHGRATDAIAGLGGGPVALLGYGVNRRAVGGTIEGGATYRATEAVSLFVTGSGELSRGNSSGSITGGIKVRF